MPQDPPIGKMDQCADIYGKNTLLKKSPLVIDLNNFKVSLKTKCFPNYVIFKLGTVWGMNQL